MKLLICTQAVDRADPILGFFHQWIIEFAQSCERVEVICLREGEHAVPRNVRVFSLGKEKGARSKFRYALRFLRLAFTLRDDYDAVFVHMNQEYILLGGILWRLLGKKIYLWRNHFQGSRLTDMAALFCTNVFCTSQYSYTAKYRKTILMPVGVDTGRFTPEGNIVRKPNSVLFLARMAPSKRPEVLLEALEILAGEGAVFAATLVGSPLPQDEKFYEGLKEGVRNAHLGDRIQFVPAVPNSKTPELYRAHEIFVNTSPSGMLDKTIFEAAACGCLVLATSSDWAGLIPAEFSAKSTAQDVAGKLRTLLLFDEAAKREKSLLMSEIARSHSLKTLVGAILKQLTK